MRNLIAALMLVIVTSGANAQSKSDSTFVFKRRIDADSITILNYRAGNFYMQDYNKSDTVKVLAYVCTNFDKAKFKWIKAYAIRKRFGGALKMGELSIYESYLMADRKTPLKNTIIYSISK